jgi:hypothetical protein
MMVELKDRVGRADYERELDLALAGSFPASDPLPWTLGIAAEPQMASSVRQTRPRAAASDVIIDSRSFGRRLATVVEVIALAALVPIAILLIGLPIVAAIRATVAVALRMNF